MISVPVVPGADVRSLRRLQWLVCRGPQGSGDAHLTAAQGAPQGYIHCKSWISSPLVKYLHYRIISFVCVKCDYFKQSLKVLFFFIWQIKNSLIVFASSNVNFFQYQVWNLLSKFLSHNSPWDRAFSVEAEANWLVLQNISFDIKSNSCCDKYFHSI